MGICGRGGCPVRLREIRRNGRRLSFAKVVRRCEPALFPTRTTPTRPPIPHAPHGRSATVFSTQPPRLSPSSQTTLSAARSGRAVQAAPIWPVEVRHQGMAGHLPRLQGRYLPRPADASGAGRHRSVAWPSRTRTCWPTFWILGVNNLKTRGRWAFAEFTDVYEMQEDFAAKVEVAFEKMLADSGIPKRSFLYTSHQYA